MLRRETTSASGLKGIAGGVSRNCKHYNFKDPVAIIYSIALHVRANYYVPGS